MSFLNQSFTSKGCLRHLGDERPSQLDPDRGSIESQLRERSHSPCHSPDGCEDCRIYNRHLDAVLRAFDISAPNSDKLLSFNDGIQIGRSLQKEEDDIILSEYRSRLRFVQTKHTETLVLQMKYRREVEDLKRELIQVKEKLATPQMARTEPVETVDDNEKPLSRSSNTQTWDKDFSSTLTPESASSAIDPINAGGANLFCSRTSSNYPPDIPTISLESETTSLHYPYGSYLENSATDDVSLSKVDLNKQPTQGTAMPILDDLPPLVLDVNQMESLMFASHMSCNTAILKQVRALLKDAELTPSNDRTPAQNYLISNWRSPKSKKKASKQFSSPPSLPAFAPSSLYSDHVRSVNPNSEASFLPVRTTCDPPSEPIFGIEEMSSLIRGAHETGDTSALKILRALLVKASQTPRGSRTPAQIYLLLNWRSPAPRKSLRLKSSTPFLLQLPGTVQDTPELEFSSSECPPEIFVDASAHGIGFIFNEHWLAWTFDRSHKGMPITRDGAVDISWAELVAVDLGLRALLYNANVYNRTKPCVLVRSDNEGVVAALTKHTWCSAHGIDIILEKLLRHCKNLGVELTAKWVPTKENPADGPSRGVYPPAERMLGWKPEVPENLKCMVSLVH